MKFIPYHLARDFILLTRSDDVLHRAFVREAYRRLEMTEFRLGVYGAVAHNCRRLNHPAPTGANLN